MAAQKMKGLSADKERWAGNFVCLVALAFTLAPLIAFLTGGGWTAGAGTQAQPAFVDTLVGRLRGFWDLLISPGTARTLAFSVSQALVSSLLALLIGLPGAYFVANYQFPGRKIFLALSAVPFCLPSVLVVLAFVLFYGKAGWFGQALRWLGLAKTDGSGGFLYGFWGLVLIHAFYNFPIVIQSVGSVWGKLPKSREEAARTLGAGRLKAFRVGTLPYLLPSILQSASLIFLFCFFSFTIVLVFGSLEGSTLEVDIYRALRFTGNRPKALVLGAVQTVVALVAVWSFSRLNQKNTALLKDFGRAAPRKRPSTVSGLLIAGYSVAILVFFIGPLASLVVEAFTVRDLPGGAAHFGFDNFGRLLRGTGAGGGSVAGGEPLTVSLLNSLLISGCASLIAISIGLAVAASARTSPSYSGSGKSRRLVRSVMTLPMAISPALTAFGWAALSGSTTPLAIIAGQSTIAWPFVSRSVNAALDSLDPGKHEAARTLGASSATATLAVDFGEIRPSILSAAAFAFSMTLGDANIALVLGGGAYETLPLLVYRLISSYRFSEACAAGIVLALLTGVAFFFKEKSDETS